MRKSLIGICVSIPLALVAVACSDDDDNPSMSNGGAENGGEPMAGTAGRAGGSAGKAGGSSQAGSVNAGTSSGGAGQAGEMNQGGVGPVGDGGATDGGTSEGGAGGQTSAIVGVNAVYTMSNAAAGNKVLGFLRADDGSLAPMAAPFDTTGQGTGAGLGEQGAVAYDVGAQRLYVVNAGDHSFTAFRVEADGSLSNAKKVTTAGFGDDGATLLGPKSITFRGDTVYVLFQGNANVASKIAGWKVTDAGSVLDAQAIAGSALALSSATQSVDPAQVSFSPDGDWLVVTEKQSGANGTVAGDGSIDTFNVNAAGLAVKKGFYATGAAPGGGLQKVPFGFAFAGGYLVVSEAGSTGTGSYSYDAGVIAPVASSQFLSTAPAPCWVAASGPFAYVANAQGPNLSGFKLAANGALSSISPIDKAIVASTGRTITGDNGPTIQGPTDESVSVDGKYLYVLNARVPSIGIFEVAASGTLNRVGTTDFTPAELTQLPVGSVGLAAR
jgi:6-phosphogluconolactonase